MGFPSSKLPESINSSKQLLDGTNIAIKNRSSILKRVNESYNVTITELEEYRRNRPLVETLKAKNLELEKTSKRIFDLKAELFKRQYEWSASNYEFDLVNMELKPPIESGELYNLAKDLYLHPSKHADVIRTMRQRSGPHADTNKVNIFNPPQPPAHTPTTLLFLPSGTPICRTGTATPNPTQPTQSELPGLLKGVNPVRPVNVTGANPATSTTSTTQPTNTLPFSNSKPNPQPTLQNTTTAITLPPPPSASNPTPNITSSGPRTSESNTTPTPSTPSNQQTITQGCGQGTDNSTCRSNPNPPPTRQNTTTNLVGDCNANPNDRSCLQQNINNNQGRDNGNENNNNGG